MELSKDRSLAEQIAEAVIQYIIKNQLKAGDKIPKEIDLAESFHVGRSTVREAIKILVSQNIVEAKKGAGTFVSHKLGLSEDPLGLKFINDRKKLAMDLLDIRLLIEPEMAALAARNATEEERKSLLAQCMEVEKIILSGSDYAEEDAKLHKMIASASGNGVVGGLLSVIDSSVVWDMDITKLKLKNETLDTHREIVEAIAEGDGESARYAMYMHLIYNRSEIKQAAKPVNQEGV